MTHTYKASCARENLRLIREFVNLVIHNYPLSEIEINQLILAVDEICSNLIIYSHNCNPQDNIEINIYDQNQERLIFEIIDPEADYFDVGNYQEPNLENIVQERRKGGVGLMLVHRIMDTVELIQINNQSIWKLSKKLKTK